MRIYEIEHGEKNQIMSNHSDEAVFAFLKTQCSEAWVAMSQTKKLLMRGMGEEKRSMLHAKTRIDRTTATVDAARKKVDTVFQLAGFTALRTNSISCTSSYGEAGQFGNVYIIVPKNGFAFTWSPVVGDFGMMTGGSLGVNSLKSRMQENDAESLTDLLINKFRYTDMNFPEALKSGHEVSINGEYYALSTEHYWHKIKEALR